LTFPVFLISNATGGQETAQLSPITAGAIMSQEYPELRDPLEEQEGMPGNLV